MELQKPGEKKPILGTFLGFIGSIKQQNSIIALSDPTITILPVDASILA